MQFFYNLATNESVILPDHIRPAVGLLFCWCRERGLLPWFFWGFRSIQDVEGYVEGMVSLSLDDWCVVKRPHEWQEI